MRILEVIIPLQEESAFTAIVQNEHIICSWTAPVDYDRLAIKILTKDEHSKELLHELEQRPGDHRVIIYPIEGTLPKVSNNKQSEKKVILSKFISVSKEELYEDIEQPAELSVNFILMVILSSFVAGIGILKNNVAIIIGAMVIAPFLAPNIAAAFGTILGDWNIIRKSAITGIVASFVAISISVLWGFLSDDLAMIARDPGIGTQDIMLALICGTAGVLTAISGKGSSLVGVMVAAALLPPLMRFGLLLGGGIYPDALNALLIFSTNIVCLNIAGIATFYFAGIRPGRWWEKENAKKKTRNAMIIWILALAVLSAAIFLLRKFGAHA